MREDGKMDVHRLIAEVYKRTPLWDQKDVSYHNRDLTNRMWIELSTILNQPKSVLKAKWKGLRDTFRTEIKKEQIYSETKYARSKPTWVHYKSLLFLKEQMMPKPPVWEDGDFLESHKNVDHHLTVVKGAGKRLSSRSAGVRLVIGQKKVTGQSGSARSSHLGVKKNKNLIKKPVKVKIATTPLLYRKCDPLSDPLSDQVTSVSNESTAKKDLSNNLVDIDVKQEPIDNDTVSESIAYHVTKPESFDENDMMIQTISSESVVMTGNKDTCVELSVDTPQANNLDDNYHFLMSLLPHIRMLSTERQMLLRIQMQELVYKEIYQKKSDNVCSALSSS